MTENERAARDALEEMLAARTDELRDAKAQLKVATEKVEKAKTTISEILVAFAKERDKYITLTEELQSEAEDLQARIKSLERQLIDARRGC